MCPSKVSHCQVVELQHPVLLLKERTLVLISCGIVV